MRLVVLTHNKKFVAYPLDKDNEEREVFFTQSLGNNGGGLIELHLTSFKILVFMS